MSTDTSEKAFQNDIIAHLVSTGYVKRGNSNYNKASCLDVELVLKFIQSTQERTWKRFQRVYGERSEQKFLNRLVSEISKKGTINILRNGFKDAGCSFEMFYPRPNTKKNPDLLEKYQHNVFSVIDELKYEESGKGNRLDLVIFVNGLPIITIELKDTFSQGVNNAIKQYRYTRDPRERIFKNCFVHFAMSDEEVYMATKLDGPGTKFLPFNKGLQNPEVRNDYKTSYLYNDILQINKLSNLVFNFIYIEKNEKTREEKPIFPRYHQLECVNNLLTESKPGKNFLIKHSSGSGKTKTIAWLSHGMINKFDKQDERVYDMVVVVSDRRVIDKQLQEQVKSIEKRKGVVEKIEKDSGQLKEALKSGSNIIVTTLQKFPYIMEEVKDLPKRKYAVVVDEAHSSQTGTMARKLKQILSTGSLEEAEATERDIEEEAEEELLKEIESFRNLKNVSFFAFTATPKNKTLELFGTKDENGEFHPFHTYSMKQAIEEGFILDCLKNYLSYETYFKLIKKIEDDPQYDEKRTKKILRFFVEKHPHTIKKKTEIMLNHFMSSSINRIGGRARAMVVTRSRLHAVLYKKAFDKEIQERGFPIKVLVAFSGTVKHDEREYTETSMNELYSRKSIESAFEEDPYRILVVANKFQTGFDQPLLHTMYVDKMLNGITAVQTLSRINRIYPRKTDTLTLDFANKPETIKKAFDPYYETTFLKEGTDPHKLYEIEEKLFDFQIFEKSDVDSFIRALKRGEKQAKLHNILSPLINEYKNMKKKDQVDFKKTLKRYQNIYSFLSQLIPFSDIDLEKLFIFNKFLYKKLPKIKNPMPFIVMDDVDIDSYRVVDKGKKEIKLKSSGELKSITSGIGEYKPDISSRLSKIIGDLNEAFGTKFTDDDKVLLHRVKENLIDNKDLREKIKHNTKDNVKAVFEDYFNEELSKILKSNTRFYKKVNDDEKVRRELKNSLLELIYLEYRRRQRKKS